MFLIDYKLKWAAKHTICQTSEEFNEKIERVLEQIEETNHITKPTIKKVPKIRYAFCGLITIMVLSIPTIAAVDYVKERMLTLNEQTQENYRKTAQEAAADTEAISYSRELTKDEKDRYDKLFKEYEAIGRFPKSELMLVEKLENDNIDAPVYENLTGTLYLPDRNLTDEELLTMIDFYHKADYSLQQSNETKQIKAKQKELENALPPDNAVSEVQASELASKYIKSMFGVDSNNIEVDYSETEISEGNGNYLCKYADGETTYCVEIKGVTSELICMEIQKSDVDYHEQTALVNQDLFISKAEEAKKIFYSIYGEEIELTNITCSYRKDENNKIPHGNVLYYMEFSNGDACRFLYNVKEDIFWQMMLYPNYRTQREAEEQGIREVEPDRVNIQIQK